MKEPTKSWTASIQSPIKPSSSSLAPDLVTLVTTSISSLPSTTGSRKTESTTNIKSISEELNSIPSLQSTTPVCWTSLDSTPSPQSEDWLDGPDMIETPTWKSTSLNYHPPKSSKSFGTEPLSSSEDLLQNKSSNKTSTLLKLFWTRAQKLFWLQLVKLLSSCALLFALIWVAFPFLTWVTTTDMSAFATVQYTINSVESDKVQPFRTCPTLITLSTRTELWFALRHWNSQENLLLDSGLDLFVLHQIFYILLFIAILSLLCILFISLFCFINSQKVKNVVHLDLNNI